MVQTNLIESARRQEESSVIFVADQTSELAVLDRDLFESVVCCLSTETQESVKNGASTASQTLFSYNGRSGRDAYAFLVRKPTANVHLRTQTHDTSSRSISSTAGAEGAVGKGVFDSGLPSTAPRPQLLQTASAPSLLMELSGSARTMSPVSMSRQKVYQRSTFKYLGGISGTDEVAYRTSPLPEMSRQSSFSRSPGRSPSAFAMAVNERNSPDAAEQSPCDHNHVSRRRASTGLLDPSSSRHLRPANHPMARGWLGSNGGDQDDLDDVRKEIGGGVMEVKAALQDLARGQVIVHFNVSILA